MIKSGINSPVLKVSLNNVRLMPDMFSRIEGVTVEDEINVPTMFSISFNMYDMSKGTWFGVNLDTFKLGDIIKISMGHDFSKELVVGEITDIEPVYNESPQLIIRGFDRMHRLRFGRYRRSYKDMKDSDIVKKIAVEAGLTAKAEDTKVQYPYIFQNNMSNYDFLLQRVERIGYELRINDRELILRQSQESGPPVETLELGLTLDRFSARLRALTEGSTVEVRGWDPDQKQEIVGTAQKGDENSRMKAQSTGYEMSTKAFGESKSAVLDEQIIDRSNADQLAKGMFNTLLRQFLSGDGQTLGNPLIRAGETIELKRLGRRFSGTYYVTSSRHTYDLKSGYITKFTVQRSGV